MKIKESTKRLVIFLIISISLISFLFIHGTITSGFHFVDNHEIVQINKDLRDFNGNLFQVVEKWVNNDLKGRFRPMYMIDNVLVDTLFKGNFFYISLYHAFIHVFILFFLFLGVRKIGFPLLHSFAFPILSLLGVQSAIWWRLGPNETIGMWYLSLTFLSMVYAVKSRNHKLFFRVLFGIFGIFTILCKESFLILTPAVIVSYHCRTKVF